MTAGRARTFLPLLILAQLGAAIAFVAPQTLPLAANPLLRAVLLLAAAVAGFAAASRTGLVLLPRHAPHPLLLGLALGLGFGCYMALAEAFVFRAAIPPGQLAFILSTAPWQRMALAVPVAFTDEVVYRLFLMSLLAWAMGQLWRASNSRPADAVFGAAIVVSAAVYVLLHLGPVLAEGPMTPLAVLREAMLHFSAAALWGYLFWRYGLATALTAHLSAHLPLQLGLSLLLR